LFHGTSEEEAAEGGALSSSAREGAAKLTAGLACALASVLRQHNKQRSFAGREAAPEFQPRRRGHLPLLTTPLLQARPVPPENQIRPYR
jgi:hypothetical protein